jgi:sugar O-acyltransferase (sialic acid O-acetyltransferase NeuD family)
MNSSPRLMVIGSSGHAQSVLEAAETAGFVVDGAISTANSDGDIGFASLLSALHDIDLVTTALAFGHGVNHVRFRAFEEVLSVFPQAQFPPIVHSSAWVSPTASLGRGAVVLAQASVGSDSTLGVGALINTGASLDHDSTLGDFASLGPGARTSGNTLIGPRTMLGLHAGVLQGRTIGEDTVVGAHSLVIEDIPALSVAIGTPCRVTRSREWDESYY